MESSVVEEQPKPKRNRFKRAIASHALTNAQERVDAYHALHADVIDEYLRLRDAVRGVAAEVGRLEGSLKALYRNLSNYYE